MNPVHRAVLLAVDAGPCHALESRHVRGVDRERAEQLVASGLLRLLPARGRWPRRFVVTAAGSHALGTFAHDEPLRRSRAA